MKRCADRFYYSRLQEQCLTYRPDSGDTLDQYTALALDTALPSKPDVVRRHMIHFATVVEQLLESLPQGADRVTHLMGEMQLDPYASLRRAEEDESSTVHPDEEEEAESGVNATTRQLLTVAWLWHSDLASRAEPMTGHFAHAFLLSWASLCQLFFLQAHQTPEKRARLEQWAAQDYVFYQQVAHTHMIEISLDPLRMYSVSDLCVAMDGIVAHGLYERPYSVAMKDYVYALYYRYAELLSVELGDIECVLDNPLFYERRRAPDQLQLERATDELNDAVIDERPGLGLDVDAGDESDGDGGGDAANDDEESQFEAYKLITIPVSAELSLRSEYVYDGQILFYHQLYRINLSEQLAQKERQSPLRLALPLTPERTAQTRAAWLRFLVAVTRDPDMAGFVSKDFKNDLMRLHLRHGETEQYKQRWPNSKAEPTDVLGQMRASMETLSEVHATPPCLLVEQHQKEPARHLLECIYLSHRSQACWQAHIKVVKHRTLATRFLMEQMHSLREIHSAVERCSAHEIPLFLTLLQRYYVVWGDSVYSADCFVTAYAVWLALLVRRKALGVKQVHPAMARELAHYSVK